MQILIKMAIITLSKYEGELAEERIVSTHRKLHARADRLLTKIQTIQHCKQLIKDL